MIIDGLFIYHLRNEINERLQNARLERIYQTDEASFLFIFFRQKERMHLNIHLSSQHFGCYITENPSSERQSSQVLLSLKKHLESAILKEIRQHETDRVLIFDFIVYDFIDGPKPITLILELMGRYSNLILVKNNQLIESYKKMFFDTGRQLIPGALFEFFPTNKKSFLEMTYDDLIDPKTILDRFMGISPRLATFIYENKRLPLEIPLNPTYSFTKNSGYFTDIYDQSDEKIHYETLSLLFNNTPKKTTEKSSSHAIFIQRLIEKLNKKILQLEQQLDESHENMRIKDEADLIYQSLYPLDSMHHTLLVDGKVITLDPTKTLNENAQIKYQQYHKMKRAIHHQHQMLTESKETLNHVKMLETFLDISNPDQLVDLEDELKTYGYQGKLKHGKKKPKEPLYSKIVDPDATYYIGKNSKQNQYLIHELANREDYWFHVKDAPGGHIVVQASLLSEKIIRKASGLAALFSSLKHSQSIPVDYTRIKFLKKIPGRPGFNVTYRAHQTIFIDIDDDFQSKYANV